ncbi:MAG: glycosyltransferase [Chlamydiota bacterium]|nr:glycosyltransferase [Chlamydiota bacterium]
MFKKVCFLVNYNQYESKRHFTDKFIEAFKRAGVETTLFDVVETKIHESVIDAIKAYNPDFTISFNSFLPFPDNTYLWDLLKIPHLSILLDPSLYSVGLIDSKYSIVSCVDKYDCFGLSTQNFDRVFFMPHAIERELCDEPEQHREYEVVFLGSCYDYPTMRMSWENEFTESTCEALKEACDIVLSNKVVPLQDALVMAWRNKGLPLEGVDFLKLFTYLDKYTRGVDRVELIRNINNAEVHIFGELFEDDPNATKGWKDLLKGKDNVVFHEPVSYSNSLDILKKSKICLNSSPFFKNGSHERIFAGLACGALVITNDNLFVRENFSEGENLVLYEPGKWEDVDSKITYYLENEDARQQVVSKGRKVVSEHHTWDNRVQLLQKVMPEMINKSLSLIENA